MFVRRAIVWLVLMCTALTGCTAYQPRAEWEQAVKASGRITEIDYEARRITVRGTLGKVTLRVSENAGDFENRKVGDRLYFTYYRAISVLRVPRDQKNPEVLTKYRLSPATKERPAVAMAKARQFTAVFLDYDYQSKIATFSGPDGQLYNIVAPMALQNFLRSLAPGDRVSASIEEALAVSLQPLEQVPFTFP